jgi:TetR/AcrR family transcriptional regulator, cholesterol catabolism regulator
VTVHAPEPADPGRRTARAGAPLTARGDAKREKILEAAAAVLARSGYSGAGLAEIASLAGTHAGSLYYYFDSREELVEAVLTRGVHAIHHHVLDELEALGEHADPEARLATAIHAHIEYMLQRSDFALAGVRAIGQVPEDINRNLVKHQRTYGRMFGELIEAAAAQGRLDPSVDLAAVRMLIIGAANWTAEWFRPDGSSSAEEVAGLLTRMVFDGLRRPPRPCP